MKQKKLLLFRFNTALVINFITVIFLVLGLGSTNFLNFAPAIAQRITPSDVWQIVYQKLPNLPKENQYTSKDTGKVAENNTLASRLISYHIYVKGRSPIYRFDWKLTVADYLGANEVTYETSYPGYDSLKQNPLPGDRAAIAQLTRKQRNDLVQVLVDIFNSGNR